MQHQVFMKRASGCTDSGAVEERGLLEAYAIGAGRAAGSLGPANIAARHTWYCVVLAVLQCGISSRLPMISATRP